MEHNSKQLVIAGIVLGIGLGGFFDGILFHQILQTHHMLSNVLYPSTLVKMQINMFWDGLFHAFTWLITFLGIFLLWKTLNKSQAMLSGRILFGSLFIGWGLFNIVEGPIDHTILQLHHVIQNTSSTYQHISDFIFLILGFLFIILGWLLMRYKTI